MINGDSCIINVVKTMPCLPPMTGNGSTCCGDWGWLLLFEPHHWKWMVPSQWLRSPTSHPTSATEIFSAGDVSSSFWPGKWMDHVFWGKNRALDFGPVTGIPSMHHHLPVVSFSGGHQSPLFSSTFGWIWDINGMDRSRKLGLLPASRVLGGELPTNRLGVSSPWLFQWDFCGGKLST